ncbi:MAG: inositol monophosphatase [Candidatus Woesearchaeota archaeon]|jgi:myo-inositol-1(or 4)-monophosphatase|nr:inositol monophosphatase [Candidatus Woesearchaeota archaeon]
MREDINLEEIRKVMKKAILKGAKIAKKGFLLKDKGVYYKDKEKRDIVTIYDLLIEKEIVKIIQKKFPNHNILAEEGSSVTNNSDYTWIIDPIDGTRNYSREIPIFMVTIAFAKKNDVIMCYCNNPVTKELYFAQEGKGAYFNSKRLKVSDLKLENSDVILSGGENKSLKKKLFSILLDNEITIRNYYSLVFSTALVASGRVDALISASAKPWDYCCYLLVLEAGGCAVDFKGEKFDITKKELVLTNLKNHKSLLNYLKILKK